MTAPAPLPSEEEFGRDFQKLCNDPMIISFSLSPLAAWAIMCSIQLAYRHPKNTGPTQKIANQFACELQKRLAITPVLAAIAEAGWHTEHDVDPER